MRKTKKDPSLVKIIALIALFGAVALCGARLYYWFESDYLGGKRQADDRAELDLARQKLQEGDQAGARTQLEAVIDRARDDNVTAEALLALAEVEQAAGDNDKALALLQQAKDDFPNSPSQPNIALAYGRLLEQTGRASEAVSVYESVRDETSPNMRAPALTGLGRNAEKAGDLVAARDSYRQAVREAAWGSDAWNEAADALGRTNVTLIFSPTQLPESKFYTVEKGDNLMTIGVKLNTTLGLLMRANGIDDPTKLWPAQRLKYTPKDFQVIIECSTCRLFLTDKDGLFKRYSVGLGKPGHETTPGSYMIGNKEKDPIWHKKGEGPIPAGDPRNELGTRWMPLVPVEEGLPQDLGIHGTIKPETVGTYASSGCARLLKEDVEELYDLVVRSTPVRIVDILDPKEIP